MSKKPSVVALIESLYGASHPKEEEHEQLVSLTFDVQFALLFAFIDFVPMDRGDNAAMLICKLAFPRKVLVATVTSLVEREVQMCMSSATLFRNNSMASRVIGHAARSMARRYFRLVLQEVLLPITTAEPGTFEVDPDKVAAGSDVLKNVAALSDVCSALLDSIFKHIHHCPIPIRRLCAIMRDSVLEKFPQQGNIAIGSFFFLRFINPALSLPEQYELVPSVTPDIRRSMILITKVLQQLANEVDTFKEQYMAPFSPFVQKYKEPLRQFYREICSCQDEVGFLQLDIEAEFSFCPDLNASMKSATAEERRLLYKLFHDKKEQISDKLAPSLLHSHILCAHSIFRFAKNVQEFELHIASMAVVYDDPDDDGQLSVVSVGSTPPVRSRSSTTGRSSRAVSVSDANYEIIQKTMEVSYICARCFLLCQSSRSHVQEQRMLQQMDLMNSALSVEAMVARDHRSSVDQRSQTSKEARPAAHNTCCNLHFRLLSVPTDAHWCRRRKKILSTQQKQLW